MATYGRGKAGLGTKAPTARPAAVRARALQSTKGPPPRRPPAKVAPPNVRAESLIAEVARLHASIEASFYAMGRALAELAKPEHYRALGYPSFGALLEARGITSRMTATKLIQVANALDEKTALTLGIEKSYALLRYANATRPGVPAARLAAQNPQVLGTAHRLADASVRELRRATQVATRKAAVKRAPTRSASKPDRATRAAATVLTKALRARGLPGARAVPARAKGNADAWTIHLDLDAKQAELLAKLPIDGAGPAPGG